MGNLLMMEKLVQAFLESEQRGMASQTPLFSLPSQIPCDKSDNATKTCEVGIQTDILSPYVLASGENTTGCFDIHTPSRGVARIFQRGGITEATHPLLSLVYQRAQSYYRDMKARAVDKNTLQKNKF